MSRGAWLPVLGIDLGTTNTVCAAPAMLDDGGWRIEVHPIVQHVSSGVVSGRELMPSCIYVPARGEFTPSQLALPWDERNRLLTGVFAWERGRFEPSRLVSSSKSWLCARGIDPASPCLPWMAPADVRRFSPRQAAAHLLSHVASSIGWEGFPLHEAGVVVTVPASFSPAARQATLTAAEEAGLERVSLLEEPQAALYAWLYAAGDDWRSTLSRAELILVCDIGGGTTDFSLVAVKEREGEFSLERVAVGEHILLGGDNMDLALAMRFQAGEAPRTYRDLSSVCAAARKIREDYFGNPKAGEWSAVVPARGASFAAGSRRVSLPAEVLEEVLMEGFFPRVGLDASPGGAARAGLGDCPLDYTPEPAVTVHLAAFLRRWCVEEGLPWPDLVLFNGGVTAPARIRSRILDCIARWAAEAGAAHTAKELRLPGAGGSRSTDPSRAVAVGACYRGMLEAGARGVRISAPSPRSYYVLVGEGRRADGSAGGGGFLCVMPRGTPAGREVVVSRRGLRVIAGEPAVYELYYRADASLARAGEFVESSSPDAEAMRCVMPLRGVLEVGGGAGVVEVSIASTYEESGVLRMECRTAGGESASLEFVASGGETDAPLSGGAAGRKQARGASSGGCGADCDPSRLEKAGEVIMALLDGGSRRAVRGSRKARPKAVLKELERVLGAGRRRWSLSLCRSLAPLVLECADCRRSDAAREQAWYNLFGYLMRPGLGHPRDEWLVERFCSLVLEEGPLHGADGAVRLSWWIALRRVGAGMKAERQLRAFELLSPHVLKGRRHLLKGRRAAGDECLEVFRAMASLEMVSVEAKIELVDTLFSGYSNRFHARDLGWITGRTGTRRPLARGALACVVPPSVAEEWIERLLPLLEEGGRNVREALVELAGRSPSPALDVSASCRERVRSRLLEAGADEETAAALDEPSRRGGEAWKTFVGDELPLGFVIDA